MITLRKLKEKDIPFMAEWMSDKETKKIFQNDFMSMTEEEIRSFINNSFSKNHKHFAIVDDFDDEYLGTISLKNIDYINMNAEYAISSRKKTRGTGINSIATIKILEYAFGELKLKRVYLNVLTSNERAKKFYLKNGFLYEGTFKKHIKINGLYQDLEWYGKVNE